MRTPMTRLGLLATAVTAGALLLPASAGAVGRLPYYEKCSPGCDIVVDSRTDLPDANPGDGRCRTSARTCTLRAAVMEANARPRSAASPWRVLVPGGHYTLTRHGLDDNASRGDLDLRFYVEVVGAGQSKTIVDGDHDDRVFDMNGGRVAHLRVTDGLATDGPGGGIRTNGNDLSYVQYVLVEGNEAAAGEAPLAGYGGGLGAQGVPVVSDSTFQYNDAVNGGGVYWHAHEASLRFSAIAYNHATADGGGVYFDAAEAKLDNATISGNSAGQHGGGIFVASTSSNGFLNFLTIASNTSATDLGGGLWREAGEVEGDDQAHISATIVAKNVAGDQCAGPGAVFSIGGNIDTDGSCNFNGEPDHAPADPLLGPLGYHGGPTPTRELLPDSPAIDFVGCSGGLFDQRGAARPFGPSCDSGAYEVGSCCLPQEKPFIHRETPPPVGYCGVIIRGSNGPDVLVGNRRRNDIHGRSGDDRIFGRFQADCLHGGRGNDFIRGGSGTDALQGDSGDDNLIGGDQEDIILGESGRDRLLGGADDDKLYGGPGPDFIRGGDGFDVISAGPGNDTIDVTGGGSDRVDCGSGNDTVRAKRLSQLYGCEHVHYVD